MIAIATEIGATILLKATVIVGIAGLATTLMRKQSAAARYAVWSVAFIGLLTLPALAMVLPSWGLQRFGVDLPVTVSSPAPREVEGIGVRAEERVDRVPPSQAAAQPSESNSATVAATAVVLIWLVGALVMLGRLALHLLHVARITRRGRDGAAILKDLPAESSVRIVISDEVVVPASWGMRNPAIILPATVKNWPTDRVAAVVTHEAAHIARRDYAVHLTVEATVALFWLNPLVWLAARRSSVERERACDDAALQTGVSSSDYATHLLDIARMRSIGVDAGGALGMARRSGLAERVRSILSEGTNRSPLGRSRLLLIGVLALVIAVPVAAFQVLNAEQELSVDELIANLESNDRMVRRRAAWELGEREDFRGVPALITRLQDDSPEVRQVAAWALGEIKDPQAIEALSQLVDDTDPFVREMAVLALGEIEHPNAIEHLTTAFERHEGVRPAVVWALGEIDTDEAAEAQRTAASRLNTPIGEHQEVWSGDLDDEENPEFSSDVTALTNRLRSSSAQERRSAAWQLGMSGDVGGVDSLLEALRDPEPPVRAMVVWALDEISPRD